MSANANAWQARGAQVNGPTQESKEGVQPGERICWRGCRLRKGFSADQNCQGLRQASFIRKNRHIPNSHEHTVKNPSFKAEVPFLFSFLNIWSKLLDFFINEAGRLPL
jgi:hypothetical protein